MRLTVAGGKSWDLGGIDDVPLWGMIRIEKEVGLNEAGVMAIFAPLQKAAETGTDIMKLPDVFFVMGIAIWMARMADGERIGFEDACDFPLSSVSVELTDAEKAEAEKAEAAAKALEGQPGVRPTVGVNATPAA